MNTKKIWLGLGAAIATTSLLAACTTATAPEETTGTAPEESVEKNVDLRVVIFSSNPDHLALLNSLADEFIGEDLEVESVAFETVAIADLTTVLTTQVSSNDAPDLSWLPVRFATEFAEAGVLLDVKETLENTADYDLADQIPDLMGAWNIDGGLYGVPFSTSIDTLYYNADRFVEAGQSTPDEMIESGTWNWESLQAAAKAITDSQGVPGYVYDYSYNTLVAVLYSFNARPWDDVTGTECTMDTPNAIDAMTTLHDMIYQDGSVPLPGQTPDFFGGNAGTNTAFISSNGLLADATYEWGIVPMPEGAPGALQEVGQSAFVAFEASETPDAAARFLAFVTNKSSAEKLSAFFIPSRASLRNAETINAASPRLSLELIDQILEAERLGADVEPITRNATAAQTTLMASLDAYVFQPEADIPDALARVCADLAPVLID